MVVVSLLRYSLSVSTVIARRRLSRRQHYIIKVAIHFNLSLFAVDRRVLNNLNHGLLLGYLVIGCRLWYQELNLKELLQLVNIQHILIHPSMLGGILKCVNTPYSLDPLRNVRYPTHTLSIFIPTNIIFEASPYWVVLPR